MQEAKNVLPIWQPVGFSTHLIAQRVAELYGLKTSHTGTLDPMAEGVIVVLLGEERKKKIGYAEWRKKYIFEITFGVTTDTFDGMGIINNVDLEIGSELISLDFVGKYTQSYPEYSTKKIAGKHLHEYARENIVVSIPEKEGEIYSISHEGTRTESVSSHLEEIMQNIKKVSGDFRQKDILFQWDKFMEEYKGKSLSIAKFTVEMSKGLYVRSLAMDICNSNATCGFVSKLVRIQNGNYTKEKCKSLKDIFGSNYLEDYDFVSRSKS